ncbi:hypothetical protein BLL69_1219 [Lacticaseibacillus paracasei]|nr:hypothetical protein BLL69_1219 [Lacticaseibacillus paracasei]
MRTCRQHQTGQPSSNRQCSATSNGGFFRDSRLRTPKVVELLDYLADQPEQKREDAAALMLRLMKL